VRAEVKKELERIRQEHGGILHPRIVVNTASDPDNVLHECFCWDDTKAADSYRMIQARNLIRVCVEYVEHVQVPVRAYVSLAPDRIDGGYRALTDVLTNESLKEQLLYQAKQDMRIFESKYAQLSELSSVFSAMRDFRQV
jgi:hypothetical protein